MLNKHHLKLMLIVIDISKAYIKIIETVIIKFNFQFVLTHRINKGSRHFLGNVYLPLKNKEEV